MRAPKSCQLTDSESNKKVMENTVFFKTFSYSVQIRGIKNTLVCVYGTEKSNKHLDVITIFNTTPPVSGRGEYKLGTDTGRTPDATHVLPP